MDLKWDSSTLTGNLPQIVISIFVLTILSSALFMFLVNRPVYDDVFNFSDVHAYAQKGVSISSIKAQRNPPGPVSFIWMAAGARMSDVGELRAARLAVLFSWVLLVVGGIAGIHYTDFPHLWYGALLVALVFPYSLIASTTLLTEGPAMLFAALGVVAWIEAASRPKVTPIICLLCMAGGLAMGAAVVSRQYNLALLPAAAVLGLRLLMQKPSSDRWLWFSILALSLTVAVAPVLVLIFIWRGITSPGIAAGTSYPAYHAGPGLNFLRPITAGLCVGFYLIPLTFPAMRRLRKWRRWEPLLAASALGIIAIPFETYLVNIGLLNTVIRAASRLPMGGNLIFGFIVSLTVYNTIALCLLAWEKRAILQESPPFLFALLTVLFYVGEQFVVGGNIPFYDRYVLPLAPFLGLIAFSLIPRISFPRLIALAGMYLVSQMVLWLHAFKN
jgi:hypothetical protein